VKISSGRLERPVSLTAADPFLCPRGRGRRVRQLVDGILHGYLKTGTCYDETKAWAAHHANEEDQQAAA
jgi:hypothetical protein